MTAPTYEPSTSYPTSHLRPTVAYPKKDMIAALSLVSVITLVLFIQPQTTPAMVGGEFHLTYSTQAMVWTSQFNDSNVDQDAKIGAAIDFGTVSTNTIGFQSWLKWMPPSSTIHFATGLGTELSLYQRDPKMRSLTITPGIMLAYQYKRYAISPFLRANYGHTFLSGHPQSLKPGHGLGFHSALGARLWFAPHSSLILAYEYNLIFYPQSSGVRQTLQNNNESPTNGQEETVRLKQQVKREGFMAGIAIHLPSRTYKRSSKKTSKSP